MVRRFAGFAAAAAVLLAAGLIFGRRTTDEPPQVATRTYSTGVGQRDSVTLDDGSSVMMGPATRIVVTGREVSLVGEAFFTVTHDETRPFTVYAGDIGIRDLGTEFSVHNDPAEPVRVVTVYFDRSLRNRL